MQADKKQIPNDLRRIILLFTSLSTLVVFLLTGFLHLLVQTNSQVKSINEETARTLSFLANDYSSQTESMNTYREIKKDPRRMYLYFRQKEVYNSVLRERVIYKRIFTVLYNKVNDTYYYGYTTSDDLKDDTIAVYNSQCSFLITAGDDGKPEAELVGIDAKLLNFEPEIKKQNEEYYDFYAAGKKLFSFSLNPAKLIDENKKSQTGMELSEFAVDRTVYDFFAVTCKKEEIDRFFSIKLQEPVILNYFSGNKDIFEGDFKKEIIKNQSGKSTIFIHSMLNEKGRISALLCMEVDSSIILGGQLGKHIIIVLFTLPIFLIFTFITYKLFIYYVTKSYTRLFGKLLDVHKVSENSNMNSGKAEKIDIEQVIIDLAQKEREKLYLDPLTKLFNRRYFEEIIINNIEEMRKKGHLGIVFVDLDDFKYVNDNFGHFEGDRVLKAVSTTITNLVREGDIVLRWGGEEILIILSHCKNVEDVASRCLEIVRGLADTRIVRDVTKPANFENIQKVTVGGVAYPFYPENKDFLTMNQHIALADSCMYYGKRNGKNMAISLKSCKMPDKKDMELFVSGIDYCIEKGYYKIFKNGKLKNL